MKSPQTAIIGVGLMLLDSQQRVLMGYRNKKNEAACWCFPGGKIDAKESLEQAAVRELMEETGLDLREELHQIKPFLTMVNTHSEAVKMTFGCSYQLQDERLKEQISVTEPHIFECWQWFDLQNLPLHLFPETGVMLNHWLKQPQDKDWKIYSLH